jgi:hypothetical protein
MHMLVEHTGQGAVLNVGDFIAVEMVCHSTLLLFMSESMVQLASTHD